MYPERDEQAKQHVRGQTCLTWPSNVLPRAHRELEELHAAGAVHKVHSALDALIAELRRSAIDERLLCSGKSIIPDEVTYQAAEQIEPGDPDVDHEGGIDWGAGSCVSAYMVGEGRVLVNNRGALQDLQRDSTGTWSAQTLRRRPEQSLRGAGDAGRFRADPMGGLFLVMPRYLPGVYSRPEERIGGELLQLRKNAIGGWSWAAQGFIRNVKTFDVLPSGDVLAGGIGDLPVFRWNREGGERWTAETSVRLQRSHVVRYGGMGRIITGDESTGLTSWRQSGIDWHREEIHKAWTTASRFAPLPNGRIVTVPHGWSPNMKFLSCQEETGWQPEAASIRFESHLHVQDLIPLLGEQILIRSKRLLSIASKDTARSWRVRTVYSGEEEFSHVSVADDGRLVVSGAKTGERIGNNVKVVPWIKILEPSRR